MRRNWFVDVVMDPKMQKSTRALPSHLKVFGLRKIIYVKDENNKTFATLTRMSKIWLSKEGKVTTLT